MPIILDTPPVSWGPTPFRFENMWLEHSGFHQECEQWWRGIEVEGWESYRMMEKLRALKDKIKAWHKEVFGDTRIIKKEVVEKIVGLDKKEEMTQLDVGERELRLILRNHVEELVFKEAVAWRQKMKFRWIKEWDYNSAMFHRMVGGILMILIGGELPRKGRVGWRGPLKRNKIKKAVFEIEREKSLGPDGYTDAFFQDCWGILKNDMVKIFEEFHRNGKVCGNINHTFLCLIPKKLDVQQVEDFRGLRQGDPLSPFLFILVADILGRMMDKAVSIGEVKGFKVGREEVVVSHLQFADDTLFLLDPDQINIQKVHTILKFFIMCFGLKINMNKSSLVGIHMEDA
ncbi:hypothetical protein UlMin_016695 [Ulmus minor]